MTNTDIYCEINIDYSRGLCAERNKSTLNIYKYVYFKTKEEMI